MKSTCSIIRSHTPRLRLVRVSHLSLLTWALLLLFTTGQQCAGPVDGPPSDPCAQAGVICTVAGTGQALFDGDGKDAIDTSFYYPLDVEFDGGGRTLILDWNNWRVRRINEDNTIETIMGLDYEDSPIPGALARETPLHHASDIDRDAQGRMYVAGNHSPVVFRVNTDDRVEIVAGGETFGYSGDGGLATAAELTAPFGVVADNSGGFYLSDVELHVVRHVDAQGMIQTVAGTGERGYSGDGELATEAMLNGPTRLRLDPQGRLLICDTNNHAIRRLDQGIITTIAGVGTLGYAGDGGAATDARLNTPYDVRFSSAGDLYIADTGNNVIRRVDTNGLISTVVGTGVAGFSGDEGDADLARLNRPSGVIFDSDGNMWIADTFNERVRRVADFLGSLD